MMPKTRRTLPLLLCLSLLACKSEDGFVHSSIALEHLGMDCGPTPVDKNVLTGQKSISGDSLDNASGAPLKFADVPIIPAERGTTFGAVISFNYAPQSSILTAHVNHPPMGDRKTTTQNWPVKYKDSAQSLIGYQLEDPEDLIPGTWTFKLYDGETLLLEKSLELSPSREDLPPKAPCLLVRR
ncbi:MAG: DUF3859 domain-containing protein [Pseudoruegeria sp.]